MAFTKICLFLILCLKATLTYGQEYNETDNCSFPIEIISEAEYLFANTYIRVVQLYEPWQEIFNTSTNATTVANIYYDILLRNGQIIEAPDAESAAMTMANATSDTFDEMTPCMYAYVFGLSAARILIVGNVLTEVNGVPLAIQFALTTINAFASEKFLTNHDAIAAGITDFLMPFGVLNVDNYANVTRIVGDILYEVTGTGENAVETSTVLFEETFDYSYTDE